MKNNSHNKKLNYICDNYAAGTVAQQANPLLSSLGVVRVTAGPLPIQLSGYDMGTFQKIVQVLGPLHSHGQAPCS